MGNKTLKECRAQLLKLLKKKTVRTGRVRLSSGKISNFYVDGRLITLSSEGAYLVANIILEMVKDKRLDAIGGPTIGADPIVGALACLAHVRGTSLKTFIVRKAKKEHGTKRQIEGPRLKRGAEVVIVDDVATTGHSLIEARDVLRNNGISVSIAIVIVDRQEGARENLKKYGIKLLSIFKKKDLIR